MSEGNGQPEDMATKNLQGLLCFLLMCVINLLLCIVKVAQAVQPRPNQMYRELCY